MTKVASYYAHRNRPRSVTVTMWGALILAVANGWRAIGLGQQSSVLLARDASLNPWVGLALALLWSIVFLVAAAAVWRRLRWTQKVVPGLLLVHGLYQVALVLFFARSAASRNAWPLIGLLFMAAAVFSVWALYRPSVHWYFDLPEKTSA